MSADDETPPPGATRPDIPAVPVPSETARGPAEGGWRERAEKAEARLAELAAEARAVMGGYPLLPFVRAEKILAITGTGEEPKS